MHFLTSILPSICVLGVLIIIHELGHFIACRLTKVDVEKFSIGFGPEIFHWQGKKTRYALSLLPLGGFVKPAGESWSEVDEKQGPKKGDYLAAPLYSRILIVVAGVMMNYLLAFFLFAVIFMMGRPVPGTVVAGLVEGYPAKASGLKVGHEILEINGKKVETWPELLSELDSVSVGEMDLKIQERMSDGTKAAPEIFKIAPKVDETKDVFGNIVRVKRLGIIPSPQSNKIEKYGFKDAFGKAWDTTLNLTILTHKAIIYLFMGKLSLNTLSGPIGIISMTGDAVKLGIPYLLQLTANLSISLAVINLFPIPALDGGHLFFLLIEWVTRRRVSLAFQEKATQIGFAFLLVFMGFAIFNDLNNLQLFSKIRGILPGN